MPETTPVTLPRASKRKSVVLITAAGCSRTIGLLAALSLAVLGPTLSITAAGFKTAQAQDQTAHGFAILKSPQLARMLQKKNVFLVNVHIPYEGEITGTDAFIPYDEIAGNLDKLPKDKGAEVVLYCRSGRMSEIAAQEFVRLGYTQVSHLAGGMNEWKSDGYQIIEK